MDLLGEMLRWWDRWLKGRETDVEDDPMICTWMQESVPPNPDTTSGRAAGWPTPRVEARALVLAPGRHLVTTGPLAPAARSSGRLVDQLETLRLPERVSLPALLPVA